jgi:transcriptional regulator with PAS, ATPase and Fis domain
VDQSVQEALCSYDWPGNVRELENMMERLVALSMGDTIHFENLPIEYRLTVSKEKEDENAFNKAMDAFQQNFIIKVFEREGWNLVATAKALGIPLSTLKYKIKKLELSKFFPYKDR